MAARIFFLFAFVGGASFFLTLSVQAQTDDCQCPEAVNEVHRGGDGDPLYWLFQTHQVTPSKFFLPPVYCYHRDVSNRSPREIRRVTWQVAAYSRETIPARKNSPSCISIAGDISSDISFGPLFFSAARSYNTDVRRPRNGWPENRTELSNPQNRSETVQQTIQSVYVIHVDENSFARIVFRSSVESDGRESTFSYEMKNIGNTTVSMLVNMAIVASALPDLPFVKNGLSLDRDKWERFSTKSNGLPVASAAEVIIKDTRGRLLAQDIAGVYGPAGAKTLKSYERLWNDTTGQDRHR